MRYIQRTQIIDVIPLRTLVELSNDDPQAQTPDWEVIERLATDQEELVDSYLGSRYPLPFATTPTLIRTYTLNLLRYALFSRRLDGDLPNGVLKDKSDALRGLELIQVGKLSLGAEAGAVGAAPALPELGQVCVRTPTRVFTRQRLDRY